MTKMILSLLVNLDCLYALQNVLARRNRGKPNAIKQLDQNFTKFSSEHNLGAFVDLAEENGVDVY